MKTPSRERSKNTTEIEAKVVAQLTRIFGDIASSPKQILYKNWTADSLTATPLDEVLLQGHPTNYWTEKAESSFEGRLIWSGSESASGPYNGYIEGAIVASFATLKSLNR